VLLVVKEGEGDLVTLIENVQLVVKEGEEEIVALMEWELLVMEEGEKGTLFDTVGDTLVVVDTLVHGLALGEGDGIVVGVLMHEDIARIK